MPVFIENDDAENDRAKIDTIFQIAEAYEIGIE